MFARTQSTNSRLDGTVAAWMAERQCQECFWRGEECMNRGCCAELPKALRESWPRGVSPRLVFIQSHSVKTVGRLYFSAHSALHILHSLYSDSVIHKTMCNHSVIYQYNSRRVDLRVCPLSTNTGKAKLRYYKKNIAIINSDAPKRITPPDKLLQIYSWKG